MEVETQCEKNFVLGAEHFLHQNMIVSGIIVGNILNGTHTALCTRTEIIKVPMIIQILET